MAQQERDQPGVYRTHPNSILLRVSDDQDRRITRAAKRLSKTVSEFLRDAAMAKVASVEDESRRVEDEKEARTARDFIPQNPRPSRGLGLRTASPPDPVQQLPAQVAPTIIVNAVPPSVSSAPSRDEVDVLADYVLGARNSVDHEERKRIATNVILASSTKREEQERLAKALDERVKKRTDEASRTSTSQGAPSGWAFLQNLIR